MVQSLTVGGSPVATLNLPVGRDFDERRGASRWVGVLDGQMQVDVSTLPHAGGLDAETAVLVMFDYACTHCRRHLGVLDAYQRAHPGRLVRAALPVPLNSSCNPGWEAGWDEPAFADSCRLAALSYAVWRVAPEAWAGYDRWLWDRDATADADEAEAEAIARVGGDATALESALAAVAERAVFAPFGRVWVKFETPLPVTLWPGRAYDAGAYTAEGLAERVAEATATDDAKPGAAGEDDG
jgi:hypothetical protein